MLLADHTLPSADVTFGYIIIFCKTSIQSQLQDANTADMIMPFLCAKSMLALAMVAIILTTVRCSQLMLTDCYIDDFSIRCNEKGNISSLSLKNYTDKTSRKIFYMTGSDFFNPDIRTTEWSHMPRRAFRGLQVSATFKLRIV